MYTKSLAAASLFILSAAAQSSSGNTATPAHSGVSSGATATAAATGSQNVAQLVDYLLPSAPTSLSPAQQSQVASDAAAYFVQYTQSHPVSQLQVNAEVAELGASTTPNAAQQSSINDLLGQAATAALANPSAYISSVENIVNPFPFAGQVTSYAQGLVDGLRTVVGSDLSVAVPTPTSASSHAGAGRAIKAVPTGAIGAAAAAVMGLAAML